MKNSRYSPATLEVRKSAIDGKGLFATARIERRTKLGELKGRIISASEAHERARGKRRLAFADLGDGTTIDASQGGNEFRCVNHSCDPNAYVRVCYGKLEFYALKVINPQDEITCDYGSTHHGGKLRCRCGCVNCRGYL
jgi:SET domain-containing protein